MMLRTSFKNDSRQGFNLLELLVVTGIVAVLAGLLMPAISKARQTARGTQCINNQRQLVLTWNLYHGDNDDRTVANGHGPISSSIGLGSATREAARKFWVPGD